MINQHFKIEKYTDKDREQILNDWENSVLATHHFLTSTDFEEIKELVSDINFNDLQVFCITKENLALGFIGVADKKVKCTLSTPNISGRDWVRGC